MVSLRLSSVYASASNGFRLAIALVTTPLLVRLLGVQGYGIWAVTSSVIAIIALGEFEISSALNYYLAADNARRDWKELNADAATSFLLVTVLAGITTAAGLAFCPWLGGLVGPQQDDASRVLFVLVLGLPFRFWRNWGC